MNVKTVQGDITTLEVDAIVNAANCGLAKGSGVCGAIHKAAGQELEDYCQDRMSDHGVPTGGAAITPGFKLPAEYVIHAAGPIYPFYGPELSEQLLRLTYHSCIAAATRSGCTSIAFPAIGCGSYGYPLEEGARVAIEAVLAAPAPADLEVTFCLFDDESKAAFDEALTASEVVADLTRR